MQSLQSILTDFFKGSGLKNGVVLNAVKRKWHGIVGDTIAVHTCPDLLKDRTLTLLVDTPQWMHHLGFYKEEIVEKLRPYKIESIRFRLGRIPGYAEDKSNQQDIQLSEEDLRYIENTVGSINDDELKRKFRKLITNGLTKGKKIGEEKS